MEYNKTKRGLEKAAGILTIVVSAIEIVALILYFMAILHVTVIVDYNVDSWGRYTTPIYGSAINYGSFMLLFPIAFSVITLILGAKLIKSPVQADGTIKNRNGIRITALVFAILNGQWVTTGLLIAVLCLKDFKAPSQQIGEFAGNVAGSTKNTYAAKVSATQNQNSIQSIDSKISELKHLKELGVIDDEAYNKAIDKIINDYKKELKK